MAARDQAEAAGAYYGNIFTTTAGYLSNPDGMYARKIYNECLKWTEKLFDCKDIDDLNKTIKRNNPSGKLQVILEFNHRQLGYTDEWLKRKIEEAFAEGENAAADYLNIWGEGSESSPIDKHLLVAIKNSLIGEPYIEISKQGYITKWFMRESSVKNNLDQRKVILSLDTSDAVGKDDIAMVARDVSSAEVLATGTFNETNLITFSLFIVDILERFPNITLIIERRSSGVAIIDNLLNILPSKGIDPFRRMFNWVTNEADVNPKYMAEIFNVPMSRRETIVYDKYRSQFGYATSGSGRSSRDNLYGEAFLASVKYTGNTVRDNILIGQLSGLIRKNGRIDHGVGQHDDMVIAWLLGYWFLSKTKNKHLYGIPNNIVLTFVHESIIESEGGREVVMERNRQQAMKKEIDTWVEELKGTKNPFRVIQLTNLIKMKFKDIDTKLLPNYTIDSVLDNLNLEKKKYLHNAA